MNPIFKTIVKQASINLAATALSAMVSGGARFAYNKYQENRTHNELKGAMAET